MMSREHTHLLVPIESPADAEQTCPRLEEYLGDEVDVVTVVHVIEHTEGYIDPASPEALQGDAEEIFSFVAEYFTDGPAVRRELRSGTDVVTEILETADELEVSAIGFAPRPKSRLERLLRDDSSYRLITESHHPVITFSKGADES